MFLHMYRVIPALQIHLIQLLGSWKPVFKHGLVNSCPVHLSVIVGKIIVGNLI